MQLNLIKLAMQTNSVVKYNNWATKTSDIVNHNILLENRKEIPTYM